MIRDVSRVPPSPARLMQTENSAQPAGITIASWKFKSMTAQLWSEWWIRPFSIISFNACSCTKLYTAVNRLQKAQILKGQLEHNFFSNASIWILGKLQSNNSNYLLSPLSKSRSVVNLIPALRFSTTFAFWNHRVFGLLCTVNGRSFFATAYAVR